MDELLEADPDYQQKKLIIDVLKTMAKIQKAKNQRWKVKAYTDAWRAVEDHILPINTTADAQKIPGIGSGIASKIRIIIDTGTHPMLEEYNDNVKAVETLSQVHGIGPVFANGLIKKNIKTIAQLRAAHQNQTVELTNAMVIGLKYCEVFQEKIPYDEIKAIEALVHEVSPKRTFIICGSHRRKKPFSGDIDILLGGSNNHLKNFIKILSRKGVLIDDLAIGPDKYMGVCRLTPDSKARRIDILYRPPDCYWTAVSYFTGSKEHNIHMRNAAIKLGYTLNEDGLFVDKGRYKGKITKGDRIQVNSEEHLFEILGMDYLLPEEREANSKQVEINIANRNLHHPPDESDEDKGDGDGPSEKNVGTKKARDIPKYSKENYKKSDHKQKSKGKSKKRRPPAEDEAEWEIIEQEEAEKQKKGQKGAKKETNNNRLAQFRKIPVTEREQLYDVNVGVLLAENYSDKNTGEPTVDPTGWHLSEKFDGIRAVWDGKSLRSRTGKEFVTPADFTKDFPNIPLDGELYIKSDYFNETSGLVRRKEATDTYMWKKVLFMVFDTPIMSMTFEERYRLLQELELPLPIKLVEQQLVTSPEHLAQTVRYLINAGSEGGIIRKPKSYYIPTRSNTLLKVKDTHDEDAIVVGWEGGSGRNIGKLGALFVRWKNPEEIQSKYSLPLLPYWEFKVGSGFSDFQRLSTIAGFDGVIPVDREYLDKTIIIKFPELQKSGKPRHPSYLGIRAEQN